MRSCFYVRDVRLHFFFLDLVFEARIGQIDLILL